MRRDMCAGRRLQGTGLLLPCEALASLQGQLGIVEQSVLVSHT